MLAEFIVFLDKMFWSGYAAQFEDENPVAFYSQYWEFKENEGGLPL